LKRFSETAQAGIPVPPRKNYTRIFEPFLRNQAFFLFSSNFLFTQTLDTMRFFSFIFVIALFCAPLKTTLFAQEASTNTPSKPKRSDNNGGIRYGISVGAGQNIHFANFLDVPYAKDPPKIDKNLPNTAFRFRQGFGTGWSAGAFAEIPLSSWLFVQGVLDLSGNDGTLFSDTLSTPIGRSDGSDAELRSVRRFDASLQTIGINWLLGAAPFAGLRVYAGLRTELVYWKQYQQREEIVAPDDGTFAEEGRRTRNESGGEIPEVRNFGIANFNAALWGGIGYEITLGNARAWSVEPRITGSLGLLNIMRNMQAGEEWRVGTLRGGLSVRYYPERAAEFNEIEYRLQELQNMEQRIVSERVKVQKDLQELKQSGIIATIQRVTGIDEAGQEIEKPTIRVAEANAERSMEWLAKVYFTERSSVIPARYRRLTAEEAKRFQAALLAKQTPLRAYYNLLNIIGKRLTEVTDATISLTSYRTDAGSEQNERTLGKERTSALREYLRTVWGISPERILQNEEIISLPQNTRENVLAEYRAVSIQSSHSAIMRPLEYKGTIKLAEPPALRFDLDIRAGAGIKDWTLEISQFEDREFRTVGLVSGRNDYPERLTWKMNEEAASVPSGNGNSLSIKLSVTDQTNRSADVPIVDVPVLQTMPSKQPTKQLFSTTFLLQDQPLLPPLPPISGKRSATLYYSDAEPSPALRDALAGSLGIPTAALRLASLQSEDVATKDGVSNETLPERAFYKRFVRLDVLMQE